MSQLLAAGVRSRRAQRAGPPGPSGSWWCGNLAAYEADRLGFLVEVRERFGDTVRFGPRTTILSGPAEVVGLLRQSAESFTIRENFLQRPLAASDGREGMELGRLLNPSMRPFVAQSIAAKVVACLRRLIGSVECGPAQWFDPVPVMEAAISAAVAEHYFEGSAQELPRLVGDLLEELSKVIGNPFALPYAWRSPVRRRIDSNYHRLKGYVVLRLLERVKAPDRFGDLAAEIAARGGGRFPLERLADAIIGSLLAAQRVPAAAAAWMLMLVADHPAIQAATHAAVGREAAGPGRAAGSAGGNRTGTGLVERVVLESLRLYPPTWLLVRTAARNVSVAGYHFPAGHNFMMSPYVLHRNPVTFPDPEAFRPDRWAELPRSPAGYLPFGAGLHACPGRHLATTVLTALLRTVVGSRRVVRMPGAVGLDPRTTLLPEGLRLGLRPLPAGPRRRVLLRGGEPLPNCLT